MNLKIKSSAQILSKTTCVPSSIPLNFKLTLSDKQSARRQVYNRSRARRICPSTGWRCRCYIAGRRNKDSGSSPSSSGYRNSEAVISDKQN